MTALIVNAHDLCRTRLCQAASCENDAEPGWALCRSCDKRWRAGKEIVLHELVQPRQPEPNSELMCCNCGAWKVDEEFSVCRSQKYRRHRHNECKACATKRRREYRANLSPDERTAQNARSADARRQRIARRRAQTGWPPS